MNTADVHEDFLEEVLDSLRTAHNTTLELVHELRAEVALMRPIVALAEVYLDARNGLCEDDPASIRTLLSSRLLDYQQKFGVTA